ncbi:MAG: ABC transporter ATP-binding protein [Bacteroidetes bacterium]|jgi:ABC-2 type transport system ATP-binding protein|nr:ABC transporter ATP-binding protein [Bacteroidota bacterium]MBT3751539.1 ABC transporter ATP-binding protein [Bacteroidota bacterium]MBT4402210.1 ABC transporter ATP-binding protein [Bacteroidota bacterium]MBT4411322.1 ABC transporter ATP-binding protein [Bacteroidota bacterium]MBT7095109.1 ABC transporter ATP-binding protein [Bacteroidota bacterium]
MNDKLAIQCINLTKSYASINAVDGLNLDIRKGEIMGFLGPNGAGKSTSINMICGLLEPDHGKVLIFGEDLRIHDKVRYKIGICPQENIYWPKLTGLEQLQFMASMYGMNLSTSRKKGMELLDRLGLADHARKLSVKWSGGMKRRLNIALALVHDPEIIVLDEPEAGLDPQSRIMIREFITSLTPQKTVLLTTHNMDEADRVSERLAIMDKGKLIRIGTPHELKASIDGDMQIKEVVIRRKTLEDVFINLTGKSLRT